MPFFLSAYPALLIGMLVGLLVGRRQWPAWPLLAIGSLVFVALVLYQSTVPRVGPTITPFIWGLFVAVNSGGWALGVGIGVVLNSRLSSHRVS